MLSQTATGRETNRIAEINTQEKKSLENAKTLQQRYKLWRVGWVAADVNRDDKVNIQDLVIIAGEVGQIGETDADVNGDGIVDIRDLVIVAGAFGED